MQIKHVLLAFTMLLGTILLAQTTIVDSLDNEDAGKPKTTELDNIPTVTVSDDEGGEATSDQNVSSMLSSARDVFASNAAFRLGHGGYRYRGYRNDDFLTILNGVIVNDADNGQVFWGSWGGLNDVWRSRDNSIGLAPSVNGFGLIGGTTAIDTRAGHQRRSFLVSYTAANRNYNHRIMATYNTGYMKGGWAVSISASRRWAQKIFYVPGNYFDGWAYFFSVEKNFKNKHWLSFTAFGTPTLSTRAAQGIREMQELSGNVYYNSAWGYQNGVVRNSNEARRHEPSFILTHEAKFSSRTNLLTALNFSFGKSQLGGLDWYNVANPAPDFYRNIPSNIKDSTLAAAAAEVLRNDENARQINWDNFYAINRSMNDTVRNVNGIAGNDVGGKRSRYVVADRVEDTRKLNFNTTFNHSFTDIISLSAGITYQYEKTRFYKQLTDLLGGDFFVDVNMFAERQFPDSFSAGQNDIARPNRLLKVGDEYAYDYFQTTHKSQVWAQPYFRFKKIDFYFGGQFTHNYFWRTGNLQNGLFPNTSMGESEKLSYFNYMFKGGFTIKINGRNYIFTNGQLGTVAPTFRNSFLSQVLRNDIVPNLVNEKIYAAELGYSLTSPRFKLKATAFYTLNQDQTENYRFFHDEYRNFVNYSFTGVSTEHYGAELGAQANVWKALTLDAVITAGRYTYHDNAKAYVAIDNTNEVKAEAEKIYMKNFNVGRVPQLAMSYGISYRARAWRASINFNYFDWMWVQINPIRRTVAAIDLLEPGSELYNNIWNQERLKGQFTMDISGGYSWAISRTFPKIKQKTHKNFYLSLNASINNVTNNQQFIVSGNEQLRFDYYDKNPNKFATRYRYLQGIGFFVTLQLRMN